MSGLLADVFSFGNTAKRKIKGLLDDPMGSITQYINNENDRAGRFNQLTSEAAQEGAQAIKQGKSMVGPKSQQLAGLLADAYNPAGMVVWHGSPHRFTKFDSSKIGTGEGAQAYGHGLYVAESKGVGEDYAKVLASPRNRVADKAGVYIDPSPMGDGKYRLATQSEVGQMRGQVGDATQGLTDYDFPNLASAIKAAKKQGYLPKDERPLLHAIGEDGKYVPVRKAIDTEELLGIDPQYSQFIASTPGNLYKIDLPDEHIAKMLDWDKPLSQQAGGIKQPVMTELQTIDSRIKEIVGQFPKGTKPTPEAIKEVNALNTRRSMLNLGDDATGADVYNSLVRTFGDQDAASGYLRQQGIPGIRYLDGGSRGTGQGTSNFVVFPGNEDLLKILEINGKPVGGLMNEAKSTATRDAYVGLHKAPMKGNGAPLHDLTQVYPDDIYSKNAMQYYGTGDSALDRGTFRKIAAYKGNPDAPVTMYRAVPKDLPEGVGINNGDWVTISPEYAKMHGESALNGEYRIIQKQVPARKLFTNADSVHEFGYDESGKVNPFMLGLLGAGGLGAAYLTSDK